MRHLYVLAVEHRGVEAVDVQTRERVYMPIEVLMKDGERWVCVWVCGCVCVCMYMDVPMNVCLCMCVSLYRDVCA